MYGFFFYIVFVLGWYWWLDCCCGFVCVCDLELFVCMFVRCYVLVCVVCICYCDYGFVGFECMVWRWYCYVFVWCNVVCYVVWLDVCFGCDGCCYGDCCGYFWCVVVRYWFDLFDLWCVVCCCVGVVVMCCVCVVVV